MNEIEEALKDCQHTFPGGMPCTLELNHAGDHKPFAWPQWYVKAHSGDYR